MSPAEGESQKTYELRVAEEDRLRGFRVGVGGSEVRRAEPTFERRFAADRARMGWSYFPSSRPSFSRLFSSFNSRFSASSFFIFFSLKLLIMSTSMAVNSIMTIPLSSFCRHCSLNASSLSGGGTRLYPGSGRRVSTVPARHSVHRLSPCFRAG